MTGTTAITAPRECGSMNDHALCSTYCRLGRSCVLLLAPLRAPKPWHRRCLAHPKGGTGLSSVREGVTGPVGSVACPAICSVSEFWFMRRGWLVVGAVTRSAGSFVVLLSAAPRTLVSAVRVAVSLQFLPDTRFPSSVNTITSFIVGVSSISPSSRYFATSRVAPWPSRCA